MNWIIFVLASCFFHAFHLSKSTVNYNSDTSSLQVTTHIFIDDLEASIGIENLKIGTQYEDTLANDYIAQYLKKHFLFISNDTLQHSFLGKEVSDDLAAVWCYFEVPIESTHEIIISNSSIMEQFDDQKNVVTFKIDNRFSSDVIYTKDDYSSTFTLR